MAPPFRRGDMVWSYFPFAETPDIPARTRHAAIIIGAFSAIDASKMLGHPAPAYGRKFGDSLPIGIIQVPLDRARQNKNSSAFFIDTRVRAHLSDPQGLLSRSGYAGSWPDRVNRSGIVQTRHGGVCASE
ncbi:hypothetical protein GGD66_003162 [Bradyrhizobium sp. CIR48]|uniref:hypothetical protein n=1 Tax=Bradyrhizobium sp. CIR48 TaxID=2663840 RepID=UPI001605CD05|nr:hypothetical protein [Bradyrhizobium sp. CIR48]MBB4424616.1 hypothetical protein [Bradyrhizobium sp. CIR48]